MNLIDEVRIGRRLPPPAIAKHIRAASGLSQGRLAAEVGVHRVTLARWELGVSVPRGTTRVRYAQVLSELQQELSAI